MRRRFMPWELGTGDIELANYKIMIIIVGLIINFIKLVSKLITIDVSRGPLARTV